MSARETKRPRLARYVPNVLQASLPVDRWYCFTTRREGPPEGPWLVTAECVSADWMDAVWRDFITTPLGQRINAVFNGAAFSDVLRNTGVVGASHVGAAWRWFFAQSSIARSPQRELMALELTHAPGSPWTIELTQWHEMTFLPVTEKSRAVRVFRTTLLDGDSDDAPSQLRPQESSISSVRAIPLQTDGARIPLAGLHVFHTLEGLGHPEPDLSDGGGDGGDPQPTPITPSPMEIPIHIAIEVTRAIVTLGRRARERVRRAAAGVRDWFDGGGFAPAIAFTAGPHAIAMPLPSRNENARPRPLEYCAAPAANGGGQMPNPLIGGRVAVLDVGQANCDAFFDAAGHTFAYYDMGWPWGTMESSKPDAPAGPQTRTRPCTCHRPLVILSHRDLDHYRRALLPGRAGQRVCGLTWLMPAGGGQDLQDSHGPYFAELLNRILQYGGQIVRWQNAGGPTHMTFPWGFVERCTGTSVNSSGLAAWVCLRDDPGVVAARAALLAVPAEIPGGAPLTTLLLARVTAATVAGGAAALAAGTAAQDVARASVRAVLSVLAGGNAAAAIADVTSANVFGIGMAVFGVAPPAVAVATDAGNAAAAAQGAGIFATVAMRCGAAAAVVAGLTAEVLAPILTPPPAGGDAGLLRQRSVEGIAARAAVAAVLANLPGAPPSVNTRVFAETVAAALSRRDPGLAANVAAIAALRGVIAVELGAVGAGPVATLINNAHPLGCAAPNIAGAPLLAPLATEVANAAINVVAAGGGGAAANRDARDNAAAAALHVAPDMVTAAQDAAWPLTVRAGRAPFAPGERYALLNGDADFGAIPSTQPVAPNQTMPMVVAMTAMHHGSFIEDGHFIESTRIPWAPGTPAAAQATNASVAPASLAESVRAVTDGLVGVGLPGLKGHLAHAGAAAASAIYAAHADSINGGRAAEAALLTGNWAPAFASAAAAAVVTALNAPAEAGEIAIAAVHAAATRIGASYARDFVQAAQAARVSIRAGLLFHEVRLQPAFAAGLFGNATSTAVAGLVGALGGAPPGNTQIVAEGVAAIADLELGNRAPADVAQAALRIAISTLQGDNVATAAGNAYAGGALGCGCALPGGTRRAQIPHNDLLGLAGIAAELAANIAGLTAARAAAGAVPAIVAMFGGFAAVVFGGENAAMRTAAAWAVADLAGLPAAVIARAATRAVVSAAKGGDLATTAGMINSGVTAIGPVGNTTFVNTLASIGAGPLPANVTRAVAHAAIQTLLFGAGTNWVQQLSRAELTAGAFNLATADHIATAVRAVQPPLATTLVSLPSFFVGLTPAAAVTGANIEAAVLGATAFQPIGFTGPTITPTYRALIARIARAAHAAAAAAAGVGNECNAAEAALGQPMANAGNVQALMALPANQAVGITLADTARSAAYLAMVGEAERRSNLEGADIAAAVDAVRHNTIPAATAAGNVAAGFGPGALAYSYGVMPPSGHCYTNSSTLGGLGHPHPLAIAEYEARGWTRRHNTSIRANHGGRQGDAASPRGHAALEWDFINDRPHAIGNVIVHCAVCGQNIRIQH
ncbi:MAG TPA: hypothetical protein VF618_00310 [Thermoanaerobaculia bacterium]